MNNYLNVFFFNKYYLLIFVQFKICKFDVSYFLVKCLALFRLITELEALCKRNLNLFLMILEEDEIVT